MTKKPFETYAHYKIGKGFATLAVSVDEGTAHVGISYCHPRDGINKRFGRNVASARRDLGSDFSFEFERDSRKLGDQLRSEFERFVIDAGHTTTRATRSGAPPWIIHSLNRELRKRMIVTTDNDMIDCDFDLSSHCC